jgi:hypothetical protein
LSSLDSAPTSPRDGQVRRHQAERLFVV